MVCAVHQPNFLPYLGFFDKFLKSDVFVLYDTAQFTKNGLANRNRIKTPHGPRWLTVPASFNFADPITAVTIEPASFTEKHLAILREQYGRAPFFDEISSALCEIYAARPYTHLVDLNSALLTWVFGLLAPEKKILRASETGYDTALRSTAALVDLMQRIGGETYLSGSGARVYLEEAQFTANGFDVIWQEFHHPVYPQLWGEFVPNLSVLDALMHVGSEGLFPLLRTA